MKSVKKFNWRAFTSVYILSYYHFNRLSHKFQLESTDRLPAH
jgi:hypothetical protein